MIVKLANLVSVLFHPLLMPTILFSVLFFYSPTLAKPLSDQALYYILLAIFITTFLIPVFSMGALKMSSYITDFTMVNRKERILPFLFISVFYAVTTYMFYSKIKLNTVFIIIMSTITVLSFLITFITIYWKISAHSAGVSGVVGFILAIIYKFSQVNLLIPLIFAVLLAGIVMSSRLYLNSHEPEEIWAGSMLGFIGSFGSIYLLV